MKGNKIGNTGMLVIGLLSFYAAAFLGIFAAFAYEGISQLKQPVSPFEVEYKGYACKKVEGRDVNGVNHLILLCNGQNFILPGQYGTTPTRNTNVPLLSYSTTNSPCASL